MTFDPYRAVLAFCVLSNDSNANKYQLAEAMMKNQFGVDYTAAKLKSVSTFSFFNP